ncbi:MAG: hypothetical protein DWH91_04045 [Planctomycetota bacterium]|nr:MAG: hypothetical protein DWH91_04045 [Planctomycetota bacterium]
MAADRLPVSCDFPLLDRPFFVLLAFVHHSFFVLPLFFQMPTFSLVLAFLMKLAFQLFSGFCGFAMLTITSPLDLISQLVQGSLDGLLVEV